MTKLYADVHKLKAGAIQGLTIAQRYGQHDAGVAWSARITAYDLVLRMLGDPEITPTRWKRLICRIFHQKNSLKCLNCGGTF